MPLIEEITKIWFEIPDDKCKGAVEVKHLKEGEVQSIIEDLTETKTIFNFDTQKPEIVMERKDSMSKITLAAVVNWKNFYDGKVSEGKPYGEEMPCTPENVKLFCNEDGFLAFINDCREKLAEIVEEKRKASEKNCSG